MADEKCSNCGGKGKQVCPVCNGKHDFSKDDGAKKGGWEPCACCGGSGVITCPKCQGSGKV